MDGNRIDHLIDQYYKVYFSHTHFKCVYNIAKCQYVVRTLV